jgi:hypothetical protein
MMNAAQAESNKNSIHGRPDYSVQRRFSRSDLERTPAVLLYAALAGLVTPVIAV